jgi:hypothetical protein
MAIGRISGPMLLPNLERQGINLSIDGNLLVFDVTNRTITVGNTVPLYTLPNVAPPSVKSILYAEGSPSLKTYWGPAPTSLDVGRQKYTVTINSLPGFGNAEITLPLGVSSIVYNLKVSRPVKVEVFGTKVRNEMNPYTFIATADHLQDDGTVILNDGSSFQSRNYSIFANMEEPVNGNVYATVTSLDCLRANDPVTLEFYYFKSIAA